MEIRDPRYNAVGTIDCMVRHPIHGWIPFTANAEDADQRGRSVYARIVAGEVGAIAPYVALPTKDSHAR